MNKNGFILIEAIAAVMVVSICLGLIAETLGTNFRSAVRFQQQARAMLALENKMDAVAVINPPVDAFASGPQPLEAPYEEFTMTSVLENLEGNLHKLALTIQWPAGTGTHELEATTTIYTPPMPAASL